MSSQQHQSDPKVLDRRTLQRDHRVLADLLRPGMAVLDVGCGTGAITRGIAEAVGAAGTVVGVDRDYGLIERARATHTGITHLRFVEADLTLLDFERQFDVVTAARTLQWVADLPAAVGAMTRAAKPGARVVVLDYNHSLHEWHPAPPRAFPVFYARFLAWREANGWDNEIANGCPALLQELGCTEVRLVNQDRTLVRGADDFEEAASLWIAVIDHLGPAVVDAKACEASLVESARQQHDVWYRTRLERHILSMCTSMGRVPA